MIFRSYSMGYQDTLTVKYQDKLMPILKDIIGYKNISDLCSCIFLKNGKRAWLGAQPPGAIEYVKSGFDIADRKFLKDTYNKTNDVIFYDPED